MNTIDPSDLDCMHKELAALIKKYSRSAQTAEEKLWEVAHRNMEEKAIKLGKSIRGEVYAYIVHTSVHVVKKYTQAWYFSL